MEIGIGIIHNNSKKQGTIRSYQKKKNDELPVTSRSHKLQQTEQNFQTMEHTYNIKAAS
jgi:hypothetical protein